MSFQYLFLDESLPLGRADMSLSKDLPSSPTSNILPPLIFGSVDKVNSVDPAYHLALNARKGMRALIFPHHLFCRTESRVVSFHWSYANIHPEGCISAFTGQIVICLLIVQPEIHFNTSRTTKSNQKWFVLGKWCLVICVRWEHVTERRQTEKHQDHQSVSPPALSCLSRLRWLRTLSQRNQLKRHLVQLDSSVTI